MPQVCATPTHCQCAAPHAACALVCRTLALILTLVLFLPLLRVLCAGARDGSLFFWNIANGALLKRYRAHKGQVSALTPMSFNGYVPPCSMAAGASGQIWLSGGTDGMLKLWDAREKASVMTKELHTPSGVGVLEPVPTIVSPGSLVMSGGADNFVHLLDARRNLEPIYSWQAPHKNCIYSCLSVGMVPERMGGTRGAGNMSPHSTLLFLLFFARTSISIFVDTHSVRTLR